MNKKINNIIIVLCFFALKIAAQPKVVLYQGVSADILPTVGFAYIYAKDIDAWSSDPKFSKTELIFRLQSPAAANNITTPPTSLTDSIHLHCVGLHSATLWIGNPDGQWSKGETTIDVQNNMGASNVPHCGFISSIACTNPTAKKVKLDFGKCISGINSVNYTSNSFFNTSGTVIPPFPNFCFESGTKVDFKINSIETAPLDGVSTFDMVLISKHILGNQIFTDFYTQIAADVNNSGKITTSDVVELRRMILGIQKKFASNTSWRFFSTMIDNSINEGMSFTINSDITIPIITVKTGDINRSARCITMPKSTQTTYFNIKDEQLKQGDVYTLSLDNQQLDGFQATLNFDNSALGLVSADEYSVQHNEHQILMSHLKGEVCEMVFRAKRSVKLSQAINLNSSILAQEAYLDGKVQSLALQFEMAVPNTIELLQNQPNPFNNTTEISFLTPSENTFQVKIMDITGREIQYFEGTSQKGINRISLQLLEKGVYFYQLTCNGQKITKKMMAQ